MIKRPLTPLATIALVLLAAGELCAQRILVGGGVTAGTVPRALEPLCGSARRLNGIGVTARAGFVARSIRAGASLDYVSRVGVRDVAECIARSGISVDSSFARAGNSATSLSIGGWTPVYNLLQVGAEAGLVLDHSSWFVGPALGLQVRQFRFEAAARRHVTRFDEITRDYGTTSVREIARRSHSETSWGAVARLLLLTR